MKVTLLVDGYNVINAWPMLKELKDEDLAHARDKLLERLASHGTYSGYDVVVVFDAHEVCGSLGSEEDYADMKVVFTKEGETADSYIEKSAYILSRQGRRVYVVTSDGAEQQAILWAGAYRIPARELIRDCLSVKSKLAATYGEQGGKMRNEIEGRLNNGVIEKFERMRRRKS